MVSFSVALLNFLSFSSMSLLVVARRARTIANNCNGPSASLKCFSSTFASSSLCFQQHLSNHQSKRRLQSAMGGRLLHVASEVTTRNIFQTGRRHNVAKRGYSSTSSMLSHSSQDHQENPPTPSFNRSVFSSEIADFASLGIQSPVLLKRLQKIGLERPTIVQAKAFADIQKGGNNVTIGAETGSGKTLAYLLPLFDDILLRKAKALSNVEVETESFLDTNGLGYEFARAIILVPNKELVQQVIRMAAPLAGGTKSLVYGGSTLVDPDVIITDAFKGYQDETDSSEDEVIRLAILPGGLKEPMDFPPFRQMANGRTPPVDIVVATPAALGPFALKPKHVDMFADIATLIVDEADMLLDGGYIKSLEQALMGFRRADRLNAANLMGLPRTQHVFVAATLPDYGLRSVDAYLQKKFPTSKRITVAGMHMARHSGLASTTVWMRTESKKARMEYLINLLDMGEEGDKAGLKDEKVMVFLNSVKDVEAARDALKRAGFNCDTYHAKMSLPERTRVLDRFRRYEKTAEPKKKDDDTVPILVCTDLASRGLDVPGVKAVVQLQFATNVVAHLHRMGRCGRAGQRLGRGFVFYSDQEAPLVEVVREAEREQQDNSKDDSNGLTLKGPDVMEVELDENEENEEHEEESKPKEAGTVNKAFSRKRGFSRKRKKLLKEAEEVGEALE